MQKILKAITRQVLINDLPVTEQSIADGTEVTVFFTKGNKDRKNKIMFWQMVVLFYSQLIITFHYLLKQCMDAYFRIEMIVIILAVKEEQYSLTIVFHVVKVLWILLTQK